MATQGRDDRGRFTQAVRDQDILKAFDYDATDEDPYLTARDVTESLAEHWEIRVTAEAVRSRLEQLTDEGLVYRREFGPSVAYRALVAPRLAEDVAADVEAVGDYDDQERTFSIDELDVEE